MSVVTLQVENNRTTIQGADLFLLGVLDHELRYPTAISHCLESGIEFPGASRGGWDGWISLFHRPKIQAPWFPTGLLGLVRRISGKFGYPVAFEDRRVKPAPDIPEPVKIPLRTYQEEAVGAALSLGRGVLDMPPRSGKTRTMCEIHRQLALPTLWIAPTDRIVEQTFGVLKGFFGEGYAVQLVGTSGEASCKNTRVIVCTAATAVRLSPETYKSREVLVVDEWHHGSAKSYKEIFAQCDHVYYRYGMTGTFFRSGDDELAMYALLSNTIFKISSLELMKLGYLVPTYAVFLPVPAKRLRGMPSGAFQTGHGKLGIQEHGIRNQLVSHVALLLCKTGRRVLILVGTKRQGYLLKNMLGAMLHAAPSRAQFSTVEFVSTDTPRPMQSKILESFENGQEVKVLIGTSLLGEGVDLPSADALVYARGEKAEVSITQNIYRVCTATSTKKAAIVVDFADQHHKKLLQHAMGRLKIYYEEPTFHTSVLKDPMEFPAWLREVPV